MLCKLKKEDFYLTCLISSDTIHTIKDAEKKLNYIKDGENAVKNAKIPKNKKQLFYKYFKRGEDPLRKKINELKKSKDNNDGDTNLD